MLSWRKSFVAILTLIFFFSIINSLINVFQGPTTFEEQSNKDRASYPSITICPMTNVTKNISFGTVMDKINRMPSGLFIESYLRINDREKM